MPCMNGFQASKEICDLVSKNEIPPVYIIACTAYVDQKTKNQSFNSGMDSFIT